MRILTVRQPWAWAIIHGGKDVENRVRNIAGAYRGPVAVHVAGKYAEGGLDLAALDDACADWCEANDPCVGKQHPWQANVGKIIGVVDLVDVHRPLWDGSCSTEREGACSPWAEIGGWPWHLVLANPRPLAEPIPYRGALGLRTLDDDTTARILAQIGETA